MILRNLEKLKTTTNDSNQSDIDPSTCNRMSSTVILSDRQKCKYFTGLYPEQFDMLYKFLGPAKHELSYWNSKSKGINKARDNKIMSIKDELFITLLRLRRGFNIYTLSHMYNVSESYIRTIFTTWIMFMFQEFKDHKYVMFPPRQALKKNLPKVFKRFKNIRCSIDCTEFFCEMPRDYGKQGNTYSTYKHTTFKCLIAVNPNGAACFISDLYEGSMDDVSIFQKCGILTHINPGDSILVDKGFTVQDLLIPKQARIYIPVF